MRTYFALAIVLCVEEEEVRSNANTFRAGDRDDCCKKLRCVRTRFSVPAFVFEEEECADEEPVSSRAASVFGEEDERQTPYECFLFSSSLFGWRRVGGRNIWSFCCCGSFLIFFRAEIAVVQNRFF